MFDVARGMAVFRCLLEMPIDQEESGSKNLAGLSEHTGRQMRVALDAEGGQEPDGLLVRLAERVRRAAANRSHEPVERHVLGHVCLALGIVATIEGLSARSDRPRRRRAQPFNKLAPSHPSLPN